MKNYILITAVVNILGSAAAFACTDEQFIKAASAILPNGYDTLGTKATNGISPIFLGRTMDGINKFKIEMQNNDSGCIEDVVVFLNDHCKKANKPQELLGTKDCG